MNFPMSFQPPPKPRVDTGLKLVLATDRTACFLGNANLYKSVIKAIPGSVYNNKTRRWDIPVESVADMRRLMPSVIVEQEVIEVVNYMEERRSKALLAKNQDTACGTIEGIKGTLRPYQAVGVAFLSTIEHGEGAILAFDMGLGKSFTALAQAVKWINEGVIDHALVVCPAPLKYATWGEEVQKWTDLTYQVIDGDRAVMVEWDDGVKEKLKGRNLREIQYQQHMHGAQIIIMNYELFLHDAPKKGANKSAVKALFDEYKSGLSAEDLEDKVRLDKYYKWLVKQNTTEDVGILPKVTDRWAVILDEAHRIKNNKSTTTKNIMKILKPAGRKVLASGTPLENNVQELWTLADFCRPGMLGTYRKFEDRYCEKDYFGTVVAPKPQMMEELRSRLEPIMIRKTKEEAMPDLPPLTIQDYWVDMTPLQKTLYADIKEGIMQNMTTEEFNYVEALAQTTRLQQLLDSPALLNEYLEADYSIESGKLLALPSIIAGINPERNKFIIFSQYREMTKILYNFLIDNHIIAKDKLGHIHGGMKSDDTAKIQKAFQEGDMQCILMTTAGNYGLNLYKGSYVIAYDCLFNPQKMNQIYSRAHRSGVVNPVIAINMMTKESYEERKKKILVQKQEVFSAMIDADEVQFARLFTRQDFINMM